jgi:hypothetical protein
MSVNSSNGFYLKITAIVYLVPNFFNILFIITVLSPLQANSKVGLFYSILFSNHSLIYLSIKSIILFIYRAFNFSGFMPANHNLRQNIFCSVYLTIM